MSVVDVVQVFGVLLQFVVDVGLGFRGGSTAEGAHGSRGDVKVHLAPLDDYLGATNVPVADSFFVGGRGGLSRTIGDVVGDDEVAGRKER